MVQNAEPGSSMFMPKPPKFTVTQEQCKYAREQAAAILFDPAGTQTKYLQAFLAALGIEVVG